jgi:hypothetical protein
MMAAIVAWLFAYKFSKLYIYEIFFIVWIVLFASTAIYADNIVHSIRMSAGLLLFLATYILFRDFFKKYFKIDYLYSLGMLFSISSIAWYAFGVMDMPESMQRISHGVNYDRGMYRMTGYINNPDYFPIFSYIFLTYAYVNLAINRCKVLFFLTLFNIFLTFSISAYFALFVAFVVDLVLFKRRSEKVLYATVLLLIMVLVYDSGGYVASIIDSRAGALETGSGRYSMWSNALDVFLNQPLLGIGVNSTSLVTTSIGIVNLHNTFLGILVEGGIVVFLTYTVFILTYLKSLFTLSLVNYEYRFLFLTAILIFVNMMSVDAAINEGFLFLLLVSYAAIAQSIKIKS